MIMLPKDTRLLASSASARNVLKSREIKGYGSLCRWQGWPDDTARRPAAPGKDRGCGRCKGNAIDQLGHQLPRARQAADEAECLVFGQDSGQPLGAFGAQGVNRAQVLVEHIIAAVSTTICRIYYARG
jgi:hypothetical protein